MTWHAMTLWWHAMMPWHAFMKSYDDMLRWHAVITTCDGMLWWHAVMMTCCYDNMLRHLRRSEEEGGGRSGGALSETRTPHLGCGEKRGTFLRFFFDSWSLFFGGGLFRSLEGWNSSGRPVGFMSTYPGTCPAPWFRVMTISVEKLTTVEATTLSMRA